MASSTPIFETETETEFYIITRDSNLIHFNRELSNLCENFNHFIFPNQPRFNTVPVLTLPYSYSSDAVEYFKLVLFYRINGQGIVDIGPISGFLYQQILSLKLILCGDGIVEVAVRNF